MSRLDRDRYDRTVSATVHGHYWVRPTSGEVDAASAPLLVGFHGYGETAEDHLAALELLPGADGWHLAAVQALHPFYTRSGEVVASWMTRFDRDLAIEDNIRYANSAVEAIRSELGATGPVLFAGFSQGVAMAYRAAGSVQCDGLVALAGDIPPDVDPARLPRILLGRGTKDEWYDEVKMRKDLERLEAVGADVETCVFEGGHSWGKEFRDAAAGFVKEIARTGGEDAPAK